MVRHDPQCGGYRVHRRSPKKSKHPLFGKMILTGSRLPALSGDFGHEKQGDHANILTCDPINVGARIYVGGAGWPYSRPCGMRDQVRAFYDLY